MQRVFVMSLAISVVLYGIVFFWSLPVLTGEAGGLWPFDLRPTGYSVTEARQYLAALSSEGRAFYLTIHHRLDVFFPAMLAITALLAARLVYGRRASILVSIVVLMATASDYFENYFVAEMLRHEASQLDATMIQIASFWTVSKFALVALVVAALVAGVLHLLWVRGWSSRGA